jgi:Protein of unknown function (DUF2283)
MAMRLTVDGDVGYLYLVDNVGPGEAVTQKTFSYDGSANRSLADFVLDFDAEGKLLGIEILAVNRFLRKTTIAGAKPR